MNNELHRITIDVSRDSDFLTTRGLEYQTGQPRWKFWLVTLKELLDNAIDAAEAIKVDPVVAVSLEGETLTIQDNGPGIAPDVVRRIANFSTYTSNKAGYVSPTRGQQGNAFKTLLGISHVTGGHAVVIESMGTRHDIRVSECGIDHLETPSSEILSGTSISLKIPGDDWQLTEWLQAFKIYNPHLRILVKNGPFWDGKKIIYHAQNEKAENAVFYQNAETLGNGFKKWLPTDKTSSLWYKPEDMRRLVSAHINAGSDMTTRDFVRQFNGLSSSAKARAVCSRIHARRLAGFESNMDGCDELLKAMQSESRPIKPDMMGRIGPAHFKAMFDPVEDGFRYKAISGFMNNIPFVVEVAVGEMLEGGQVYTGINFSPTLSDPIETRWDALNAGKIKGYSFLTLLNSAHCRPSVDADYRVTAALHIICPVLRFSNRDKAKFDVEPEMADAIANATWHATREIYQKQEARRKGRTPGTGQPPPSNPEPKLSTIKAAVFDVLADAAKDATDNGKLPTSVRDLFYVVRPAVTGRTGKELDYNYFSQSLLPEYKTQHGELDGLYYDPRGVLYEPHTGLELPVGTREVDSYKFPELVYDKILYVEKKGMWPLLKSAQIAERYDMAIMTAEGYSTEAARTLFEKADKGQRYKLFVLHDADPDGYNIARTLKEATHRMPDYSVDIIDLGFFLEECVTMGLETEEFTRKKSLPSGIDLGDLELAYFTGHKRGKDWVGCKRIELNAMKPRLRIEYLERKLREHGADKKVIPPAEAIVENVRGEYTKALEELVSAEIMRRIDVDGLSKKALAQVVDDDKHFDVSAILNLDCTSPESWRAVSKRIAADAAKNVSQKIDFDAVATEQQRLATTATQTTA